MYFSIVNPIFYVLKIAPLIKIVCLTPFFCKLFFLKMFEWLCGVFKFRGFLMFSFGVVFCRTVVMSCIWVTYGLHVVLVLLLVIFLYNANCALKCKMGRIAVIR